MRYGQMTCHTARATSTVRFDSIRVFVRADGLRVKVLRVGLSGAVIVRSGIGGRPARASDQGSVVASDAAGLAMVFTGMRHFWH